MRARPILADAGGWKIREVTHLPFFMRRPKAMVEYPSDMTAAMKEIPRRELKFFNCSRPEERTISIEHSTDDACIRRCGCVCRCSLHAAGPLRRNREIDCEM